MVESHFCDKGMELGYARAVHTGLVMSVMETRVRGGGAFLAALPMANKVFMANTRGNWGGLVGEP